MRLEIPELCLVLLIGPSASGKSTFARRHFLPTEVISSDFCRGLLAGDENDQSVTGEAFDLLHTIVAKRLKLGRLTVVDATNVQAGARKGLVALAREFHVFAVAIVFDLPEPILLERHAARTDRQFGPQVIRNQRVEMRRSLKGLQREGFRFVHVLREPERIDALELHRKRLWVNRRDEAGPFDIIGDVHGCLDELRELLDRLGYQVTGEGEALAIAHPAGRRLVFLGDLVDRGPDTPGVIRLVRAAVSTGNALCVAGNHDVKLVKALGGKSVRTDHGLQRSLDQLAAETPEFRDATAKFLDGLISHFVLDQGRLVVAHAGLSEELQGRTSGRVREFCLYGETTGETDELGLPIRYAWAEEYRGPATVVYGHTPVEEPEWLNRTICIDTGCVFGGRLTALRYPERELVSVPARQEYFPPLRPLAAPTQGPTQTTTQPSAQQSADDLLDFADVSGRRHIRTELGGNVTVREENAAAALEAMSRFAADPKWLIYLPPTMSPSETSREPGLLEHPAEALDYYRRHGVERVICEEKHMGSRAVAVVCRGAATARHRFGINEDGIGFLYTRTGRRFFNDPALEQALLARLNQGMEESGLWEGLQSDWVCLDCELLPWSVKALDLLKTQYAPVGVAGEAMLSTLHGLLSQAAANGAPVAEMESGAEERLQALRAYRDAYARYCREVAGLADIRLAPFHLLASEGRVHLDRDHAWHMGQLARLAQAIPDLVIATPNRIVELADAAACEAAIAWWSELTAKGGEGMVVKPLAFTVRGNKGLLQPAIKCRGPEYLRIIYGPEYLRPANLERLRERGLSAKRSLAVKEFALGMEALRRFVEREPLRRVHECVFGVLALESEPIDPRL